MPRRLVSSAERGRACYFFFVALVFSATFFVAAAFFAFFATMCIGGGQGIALAVGMASR
jgi:hypothetical protein